MDEKKEKRKRRGERPDGLIQVSLMIGYKKDGRPDRKYFYGKTRAEAESKKAAYLADQKKKKESKGYSFDPDITVKEWVEIYMKTYRTGINAAYKNNDTVPYNRLIGAIGKMRVVDVREIDLQNALSAVAGMSNSTCRKYLSAIRNVFKRAKKNKIISDDPSEDLMLPPSVAGTHRALEDWEIELILKHWDAKNVRGGLMVLIMLLCGLRRGEVLALEWKSINLEKRELTVEQVAVIESNQIAIEQRAKTDAGLRIIPIPKSLLDALLAVPEEKRTGFVCLNAHGEPLSESSYNRTIENFMRGVTRIANGEAPNQSGRRNDIRPEPDADSTDDKINLSFTAHDLRHTYATALYDAGVPVKAAQYFLGPADIKITLDLYTHLSKEREKDSRNLAVEYLDAWVSGRLVSASEKL